MTGALRHDIGVAIGNILGGIALQTVVLVALDVGVPGKRPLTWQAATLLSGQAVLPQAQKTDIYLAGLGVLLTAVYVYGLIFRPDRLFLRMGMDSLVVLILYALGVVGLFAISGTH